METRSLEFLRIELQKSYFLGLIQKEWHLNRVELSIVADCSQLRYLEPLFHKRTDCFQKLILDEVRENYGYEKADFSSISNTSIDT